MYFSTGKFARAQLLYKRETVYVDRPSSEVAHWLTKPPMWVAGDFTIHARESGSMRTITVLREQPVPKKEH